MTPAELNLLTAPGLSHAARSVYLLLLRLKAEQGPVTVGLQELSLFLSNGSGRICPVPCDEQSCLEIMQELCDRGLLSFDQETFEWGQSVQLPLFEQSLNDLPALPFAMHSNWRPGPSFAHAATVSGLTDPAFSSQDLSSFISYWKGKLEKRTQIAWERTFCQRLLRLRTADKAKLDKQNRSNEPKIAAQKPRLRAQGY